MPCPSCNSCTREFLSWHEMFAIQQHLLLLLLHCKECQVGKMFSPLPPLPGRLVPIDVDYIVLLYLQKGTCVGLLYGIPIKFELQGRTRLDPFLFLRNLPAAQRPLSTLAGGGPVRPGCLLPYQPARLPSNPKRMQVAPPHYDGLHLNRRP